ncbi:hypothetical protein AB0M12_16130 [Nocardia vinacea]|uniref:hypothetical protein n=1 Tax=Nocardia vinacea TaxID=96468 RepID=UPI003442A84C
MRATLISRLRVRILRCADCGLRVEPPRSRQPIPNARALTCLSTGTRFGTHSYR